eukprot:gene13899-15338_t
MELFVGSLLTFPLLRAYSKQHYYYAHRKNKFYPHERVSFEQKIPVNEFDKDQFYEICCSTHVRKDVKEAAISILRKNPHIPSIFELLDNFGELQTAVPSIMKSVFQAIQRFGLSLGIIRSHGIIYRRELLTLADGGTVALDWAVAIEEYYKNPNISIADLNKEKIVLLLHGILGDSQSEYIYHFLPYLIAAGYTPIVYVARGNSDLPLTSPSFFSGKIANDFYEVTRYIRFTYQSNDSHCKDNNKYQMFAIGYSLGASSILNYLTRMKDLTYLTAAISICPPWNVIKNSLYPTFHSNIGSALIGIPLKLYFFRHYRTLYQLNSTLAQKISIWKIITGITIKDYDEALYPIFWKSTLNENYQREKELLASNNNTSIITKDQFQPIVSSRTHQNIVDYYHDINSSDHVHEITIPTLVLSALDDPICPHNYIPTGKACDVFGKNVVVVKTNFGGHLGYFEHDSWTHTWSDRVALDWLKCFS